MSYENLESIGIDYFLGFTHLSCDFEGGCSAWSEFAVKDDLALLARIAFSRGWHLGPRDEDGTAHILCPHHAEQYHLGGQAAADEVPLLAEHHEPGHTMFVAAPPMVVEHPERLAEPDPLAPGAEALLPSPLWSEPAPDVTAALNGSGSANGIEDAAVPGGSLEYSTWFKRQWQIHTRRERGRHSAGRRGSAKEAAPAAEVAPAPLVPEPPVTPDPERELEPLAEVTPAPETTAEIPGTPEPEPEPEPEVQEPVATASAASLP